MKKIAFGIFATLLLTACGGPTDLDPYKLGKDDAPVLIQEFSDLQCPACGVISPQVTDFVLNNPDLVKLEYYHYPLPYHEFAFLGAEAAECAGDQGKFWEFVGNTFANQNTLSEEFYYSLAKQLGLNEDQFKSCIDNHNHKAKILSHMQEGKKRGLSGTPTLYIGGKEVQFTDPATFEGYIKSLVK